MFTNWLQKRRNINAVYNTVEKYYENQYVIVVITLALTALGPVTVLY